ncbi:hypothetical protein ACTXT7_003446 [Hymenolepis weldensis]
MERGCFDWVVIYDKGYHYTENVISTCLTKVKDFLVNAYKQGNIYLPQIWDGAEIVYPPLEQVATLNITNTIETPQQTPCVSKPVELHKFISFSDSDCNVNRIPFGGFSGLQNRFEVISNYAIYVRVYIEYRKSGIRRYIFKYRENGKQYRDLLKVFGLRFTPIVSGTAGQFRFIKLFLNIGSGLGLIAFELQDENQNVEDVVD